MYNVAFCFHILGVLLFVAGIVVAGRRSRLRVEGNGRQRWRCCWG